MEEFTTDRLLQYAKYKGISISAFEKSIEKAPSYLRNSKDITSRVLLKIMQTYPDLNINWLITGEGEMLKKEPILSNPHSANYSGVFNEPINTQIGSGTNLIHNSPENDHKRSKREIQLENQILKLMEEITEYKIQLAALKAQNENKDKLLEEKERLIKYIMDKQP